MASLSIIALLGYGNVLSPFTVSGALGPLRCRGAVGPGAWAALGASGLLALSTLKFLLRPRLLTRLSPLPAYRVTPCGPAVSRGGDRRGAMPAVPAPHGLAQQRGGPSRGGAGGRVASGWAGRVDCPTQGHEGEHRFPPGRDPRACDYGGVPGLDVRLFPSRMSSDVRPRPSLASPFPSPPDGVRRGTGLAQIEQRPLAERAAMDTTTQARGTSPAERDTHEDPDTQQEHLFVVVRRARPVGRLARPDGFQSRGAGRAVGVSQGRGRGEGAEGRSGAARGRACGRTRAGTRGKMCARTAGRQEGGDR